MSGAGADNSRGVPYFRALDGKMLVFGCERTPLALVAGAASAPAYVGFFAFLRQSWLAAALGLGVGAAAFFLGVYALRRMAKADPMMCRTYLRNRRYRRHYPARSTPFCSK